MGVIRVQQPIQVTPDNIIGKMILCPHCNRVLRVVGASIDIHQALDPSGVANSWFAIILSDGYKARMWQREYYDA